MKALLVINKDQFGYLTDTFELAKCLRQDFRITIVCFDEGFKRLEVAGVDVVYVSSTGGYFVRTARILRVASALAREPFDYRFMVYFRLCTLIRIVSLSPIVLDFRTGSVNRSVVRRAVDDTLRRISVLFFRRVTVISEGLRRFLFIPGHKAHVLPLGANVLSDIDKTFDLPRLLYVGTFNNRNIHETIEGLAAFLEISPRFKNTLYYDIVGYGSGNELEEIERAIEKFKLWDNVCLHGRKSHTEIRHLYDKCNIGISYVPLKGYFDHQPPTKTFEYVLAGMACLATATTENKRYVNEHNGCLHPDGKEGFASGLKKIISMCETFDSSTIRATFSDHTWSNIATGLRQYLDNES